MLSYNMLNSNLLNALVKEFSVALLSRIMSTPCLDLSKSSFGGERSMQKILPLSNLVP